MKQKRIILLCVCWLLTLSAQAGSPPAETSARVSRLIEEAAVRAQLPSGRAEAFRLYRLSYDLKPTLTAAREMALLVQSYDGEQFVYWMNEALRLDPANNECVNLLAEYYLSRGSFTAAAELLEHHVALSPDDVPAYIRLAYAHANGGNLEKATVALEQFLKRNTDADKRAAAEDLLFRILTEQGKRTEAAKLIMESFRKQKSAGPQTLLHTANRLLTAGYYREALAIVSEHPDLVKGDLALMNLNTSLLIMNGKRDEAQQMLMGIATNKGFTEVEAMASIARLIASDRDEKGQIRKCYLPVGAALTKRFPQSFAVSSFYFEILTLTDDSVALGQHLATMARSFPDSTNVRLNLVQYEFNRKNYNAADSLLHAIIETDPTLATPYLFQSMIEQTVRQNNKAGIQILDKGLLRVPQTDSTERASLYLAKGDLLYADGEADKAFACYDASLQLNPNNALALNNYAYFLSLTGRDGERALAMAQKAVLLEPDDANILDTYAYLLYLKGDYLMAAAYMRKALNAAESEKATFYDHYADILIAEEHIKEALEYLRKAEQLEPSDERKQQIQKLEKSL